MISTSRIALIPLLTGILCFAALCIQSLGWDVAAAAPSSYVRSLIGIIPSHSFARSYAKIAQEELERGNRSFILPNKIEHYCTSLAQAGLAVSQDPYNMRFLLNWANIRQLLGNTKCNQPLTDGDVVSVLDSALKIPPKEPTVLYSAGLIYLWSNEKQRARNLFHNVLAFGQPVTPGQKQLILNSIDKPEDIKEVIPARFPHVVTWQHDLLQTPSLTHNTATLQNTLSEIADLELGALNQNREELHRGIITADIFESRIYDLLRTTRNDHVRGIIDREFSASVFTNSDSVEHGFFLRRSGLQKWDIVRAFTPLDTRPQRTSLTGWGRQDRVNFAGSYNSLGFYINESRPVTLISLQSTSTGYGFDSSEIKIFSSQNNEEWKDISSFMKTESFHVLDHQWLALSFSRPIQSKYWKIHLGTTEKTKQFVNSLDSMVNVFGPTLEN